MRLTVTIPMLLVLALALSSSAAASAFSRELVGDGSAVALMNGRGTAVVDSRKGSLLGSVGNGRIVVLNRARGARTTVRVSGCDKRRRPNARTVVCIGRGLSVSALNGSWRVTLQGRRVNASAVAQGTLRLRGTRGQYSINGGPKRKWPRTFRTFRLA